MIKVVILPCDEKERKRQRETERETKERKARQKEKWWAERTDGTGFTGEERCVVLLAGNHTFLPFACSVRVQRWLGSAGRWRSCDPAVRYLFVVEP